MKSVYARLQQKLRCTTTERDTAIFAVKNANELISGQLSQLKMIQKRLMEKESIIASQESELRSANAQKQEALGDQEKLLKKKLVAQLITKDRQVEQLKLDVKAISAQRDSSTRAASDLQIEMVTPLPVFRSRKLTFVRRRSVQKNTWQKWNGSRCSPKIGWRSCRPHFLGKTLRLLAIRCQSQSSQRFAPTYDRPQCRFHRPEFGLRNACDVVFCYLHLSLLQDMTIARGSM